MKNVLKNNTTNNELKRKITSLTLMTIMLAGGMAIGFPGMEPAHAVSPNLSISAEDVGNFAGIQVIEIVVNDPNRSSTDESEGVPNVEINGDDVVMAQGDDGSWYAYVANQLAIDNYNDIVVSDSHEDHDILGDIHEIYGHDDTASTYSGGDAVVTYLSTDAFLEGSQDLSDFGSADGNNAHLESTGDWPFIQSYNISDDSDVTITYGTGSTAQRTVIEYGYDDDVDISIDRQRYPVGAFIFIDLDDSLLNLSPVADDHWVFETNGDIFWIVDGIETEITNWESIGFEEGPFLFDITDGVYELADTDIFGGADVTDGFVVFRESNTDDNVFVNYDRADKSNLVVVDDGNSSVAYNDAYSIVMDTFNGVISFGNMVDEWLSGIELDLTLVDEDRNLNTRIDEEMSILQDEVPYIEIGDATTIDEVSLVGKYATGTLTLDGVEPGDTVTVDGLTYTAVSAESGEFEFIVESSDEDTASNLADGIDFEGEDINAWSNDNVVNITSENVGAFVNPITLSSGQSSIETSDTSEIKVTDVTASKVGTITVTTDYLSVMASIPIEYVDAIGTTVLAYINYDFTELGGKSGYFAVSGSTPSDVSDDNVDGYFIYSFDLNKFNGGELGEQTGQAYFDVFYFGQLDTVSDSDGSIKDNVDRVNDAFYRFELEETDDNTATFEGTVEYIMINQLNVFDPDTYDKIDTTGDSIVMIVNDDMDGVDAITVSYLDIDSTGSDEIISVQEDANTHTGVIALDASSYSSGNTVTVILTDADLNTDSDTIQIYEVSSKRNWVGNDDVWLSQLLIDDILFTNTCGDEYGLDNTGFTLIETDNESGIFVGTLKLPSMYCEDGDTVANTNGLDLEFEYQDYSDASGEPNETSDSASIRSNTGSVALDRTVYPVPFTDGTYLTYDGDEDPLGTGDVIVTIAINDPDFNISASGEDTIPIEGDILVLTIARGSNEVEIDLSDYDELVEVDPKSGIFEVDVTISQDSSIYDILSDSTPDGDEDGLIYQGDIITVTYSDPNDASGDINTVTDSATFDLRNAVMQTDKSVYIIGSNAIITLIEPDLNLDSGTAETWSLDLINWDSDADETNLSNDVFDAQPSGLRETGDNTGIFQVVIEIPSELDGDKLERGEQIDLEYQDNSPAGADYIGDDDEDVNVTIYTSNFGATVELDQKVYTWTDKVYITIVAPDHNFDSNAIDEIGNDSDSEINVSTREAELELYKLVETGTDTGIFTGEVILTGFDNFDADGDGDKTDVSGVTSPARNGGPTNGFLEASDEDGISVSFEFSDDEVVIGSSLIRWNIGEIQWLEGSYPASGSGIIRAIDPDMNLNPESVDSFDIDIWSDTAAGGISLRVTETNEATGIFEGTVFFTVNQGSSGSRLAVSEGDTVTASYEDNTLPDPYSTADEIDISATTLIGTIVPPLERAPAVNLRTVDAFGNSLDVVSIDQQVQVSADLRSGQDRDQDFAYLVQIQDGNGVTVSLAWITGTLSGGQSFSPALSWIPEQVGVYTATAFVWQSIDNPTALSPPVSTTINVR